MVQLKQQLQVITIAAQYINISPAGVIQRFLTAEYLLLKVLPHKLQKQICSCI